MNKARPRKRKAVTQQIRVHLETCGMTMYRMAKETGIDKSSLSRFLSGERALSANSLDTIGRLLDFEVVMHGGKRKPSDK